MLQPETDPLKASAIQDRYAAGHQFTEWHGTSGTPVADLIKHFLHDLFSSPWRVRDAYQDTVAMFGEARGASGAQPQRRSELGNKSQQSDYGWQILGDWVIATRSCSGRLGCSSF
jgi:hypothetical protein